MTTRAEANTRARIDELSEQFRDPEPYDEISLPPEYAVDVLDTFISYSVDKLPTSTWSHRPRRRQDRLPHSGAHA